MNLTHVSADQSLDVPTMVWVTDAAKERSDVGRLARGNEIRIPETLGVVPSNHLHQPERNPLSGKSNFLQPCILGAAALLERHCHAGLRRVKKRQVEA